MLEGCCEPVTGSAGGIGHPSHRARRGIALAYTATKDQAAGDSSYIG